MIGSYNPGYTGFGQDADRMANLASVLPIIFVLVAALVCLTTMTRCSSTMRVIVVRHTSAATRKKMIGSTLARFAIRSAISCSRR